jgi:uncharacterized protein (TIGR02646 family)
MEYIEKLNKPPEDWEFWFTTATGRISYDYKSDFDALPNIRQAKEFLINEQHHLCAYCQQEINIDNASIEHVIPKEHNKSFSTSYYNLVAVCNKNQIKDDVTGKYHCDRSRGSTLIPSIIFYGNAIADTEKSNYYFDAYADGSIVTKQNLPTNIKQQADAFINILNLNHNVLKSNRAKNSVRGLIAAYRSILPHQKASFWTKQYNRILNNRKHPFRQFLLSFIAPKRGIH